MACSGSIHLPRSVGSQGWAPTEGRWLLSSSEPCHRVCNPGGTHPWARATNYSWNSKTQDVSSGRDSPSASTHFLPLPCTHPRGLAANNWIWYLLNNHKPEINTCLPPVTHVLETCGWRGQCLLSALVHHRLCLEAEISRIPRFPESVNAVHTPDRDTLVWQQYEKFEGTLWVYIAYLQTVLMIVYLYTQYASGYSQTAVWFGKKTPN